jgi:hypothetical protein
MPAPRVFHGHAFEDSPFALYALLQRDDDVMDVLPADVQDFDIRIFDMDGSTPDTAIWTRLAVSPTGIVLIRQPGVGAAPSGYNFKLQVGAAEVDDSSVPLSTTGGHKYRVSVTLHSLLKDVEGARVVWEIDCESMVVT